MNYLLWALVGYISGCINGSQIIGKINGIDIRNSGVKNAGASNTFILLGWKSGVIVFIIDILKAVIPILTLYQLGGGNQTALVYITGLFVIIGHNYPVNMRFKGGKGTASLIGLLFVIDWRMGLVGFAVLLVLGLATDYLVIGVLAMYISFITFTILSGHGTIAIVVSIVLTFLSIFMHMENYRRIGNKTETKISSSLSLKV